MTPSRAPRRERHRLELALRYYPCTQDGLTRAITDALPSVRAVEWTTLAPGQGIARLRLRWWAWLALGALHARAYRVARTLLDRYAAAGTVILVRVW